MWYNVRGVDPHLFRFFMTPLKFKSTPPPREGLFDPLAGFWILFLSPQNKLFPGTDEPALFF